jgi:branched-chain amino acid transport system permease protein
MLRAVGGVRRSDVREGEIFGLVGPKRLGQRTTLINVISGFYPLTSGTITLDGAEIGRDPAHEIARRGVARTYQIPRPFANMTVLDNVALCATSADRCAPRPRSATRPCTGSASPVWRQGRGCCRLA